MASTGFLSMRKSAETIKMEILTNVMRMLIQRGNINCGNYLLSGYTQDDFNNEYISPAQILDDDKIRQSITSVSDTVKFKLDKPIGDKSKVVVIMVPYKITDIKSSEVINESLVKFKSYHKIFIINIIQQKARKELSAKNNVEVFTRDFMMIDYMKHIESPYRCEKIVADNIEELYTDTSGVRKCFANSAIGQYYNVEVGDILRVINYSKNNCIEKNLMRVQPAKVTK